MQFAQAANYPVDLYYIMDLSQSMEDDRNNLAKLGNSIAETMRKVTTNFRIGFGSFIDKTLAPFSSEYPKYILH
jgi:integrin beta 1